jgi:hypothetical protein
MRKIRLLAIVGVALISLLAAGATVASAQLAPNGEGSGVVVGHPALPHSPSVGLPHPALRFVGAPGRATGAGEALEAKASLTTLALQALAGAKWMVTRHIGLFFDYKLRTADPSFNLWNASSDMKLNITHVFGGVAVHF